MITPSRADFLEKANNWSVVPVVKEILADCDTPLSAYLKAAGGDYSFLLESVEGNEKVGRYSFVGTDPRWIFSCKRRRITLIEAGDVREFESQGDPLDELKKIFHKYRSPSRPDLPRFFGGAVGYLGYGMVGAFENIPQEKPDDPALPDACFMLADTLLAFDHVQRRIKIIANVILDDREPDRAYDEAVMRIETIEQKLRRVTDVPVLEWTQEQETPACPYVSNFTKEEFERVVLKAKEYIRSGDIFQVVLSQRFQFELSVEAVTLYRILRTLNPSPYMFLLNLKEFHMAGTSPEIMVRCENRRVEVRPIAGTTPRGSDDDEDRVLEGRLLEDPKERAEHLMLVDLGRNDVGRVCRYGTVRVGELMVIEKYSHVMHIVSDVTGVLEEGKDAFDVLRAAFPAGTVTGAPKIRAMQIIEDLETLHRGPYAGAIGYISFAGDLDTCITIRTVVLKDRTAYIQAGAGIVADSVPEKEYAETLNKARAMIKALTMAAWQKVEYAAHH